MIKTRRAFSIAKIMSSHSQTTVRQRHKTSVNSDKTNQHFKNDKIASTIKKQKPSPSTIWSNSFLLFLFLLFIAYNGFHFNLSNILGIPTADTKPYTTINEYYPYYLSQHSNPINQQLHAAGSTIVILIAIYSPSLTISAMIGALCGYLSFPVFRGYSNGIFEGLVFLAMAGMMCKLHGCGLKLMGFALLIGYGFAWVGHFVFEDNKPATFIYPTYSFICDFKMAAAFYRSLLLF